VGNVFIITGDKVIGSKQAEFDLDTQQSRYRDAQTVTDTMRIRGKEVLRTDQYTILRRGRMVINDSVVSTLSWGYRQRGIRFGQGSAYSYFSARQKDVLLRGDLGKLVTESISSVYSLDDTVLKGSSATAGDKVTHKPISPQDVATADFSTDNTPYRFKVKTLNIHRHADGFDKIVFKRARATYQGIPYLWSPWLDFGYQEDKRFLTYLGPDIGYNVDYGGLYAGPGWDMRLLDGWLRFSPYISYGGGQRLLAHQDEPASIDPQLGYGVLARYRSPSNHMDFGYSSTLREPIFLGTQQLFGRNQTRLRVGINQYYTNGFFNVERPRQIAEVTDLSFFTFEQMPNWFLRTFVTAGVAKDDFFPNRQRVFFVNPTSTDPITTFRMQLQGQFRTIEPLFYLGNFGAVGALAQTRLALYGTGDVFGMIQGGPFANIVVGPVFSQVRYLYAQTAGQTPFVFDSYYEGRNNLFTINTLDLGKYVTIGAAHSFNLTQDNAKSALMVDQKLFFSGGSENLKFSMADDTVQ
jgi:hypothetical protein